jgi:hypothetical protein
MARGNKELQMQDQPQKHIGERFLETGCVLGVDQTVTTVEKNWEHLGAAWNNNFHLYSLEWAPGQIRYSFFLLLLVP